MIKKKDLNTITKEITYSGNGLFAKASGVEAADRVISVIFEVGRQPLLKCRPEEVHNSIAKIASEYFADVEYFAVRPTQVRNELLAIGKLLARLIVALDKLPKRTIETLNQLVQREKLGLRADAAEKLLEQCKLILPVCDAVAALEGEKTSMEPLPRCCSALASLWVQSTGKRFPRTKGQTEIGNPREFTSPPVHFVHMAMHAIDPEVGPSQILLWLNRPAKRKPRKVLSKKAMAKPS